MSKSKKVDQQAYSSSHEKNKQKINPTNYEGRSFEDLFAEALALYNRAVSGDGKSAQKAVDLLAYLRSHKNGDNLVESYYGASNVLMGKHEKNPMNKGKWINKGLDIIDQAQKRDPHNTKIRILRGYACYHLPAYLNRIGTTIEDFEYLLARNEKQPGIIAEQTLKNITSDLQSARKTKGKMIPQLQNIAKNISGFGEKNK